MLNRFEKFILNITEIDLYWHRLATGVMKEYGLKGNYVVYFTELHNCTEGMTAAELCTACGKDKADVSRDIGVLERSGLVTRIMQGESGYRARILLTDAGKALTEKIITKAETAVACIGGELDAGERECFYRVLDEITANMRTLCETGIPDAKE